MKKIIFFTIISCLMFNSIGNAQTDIAKSKIAIIARYTDEGLELRWIPDNKTILQLGFKNSYTIERSISGSNQFEKIITLKAFTDEKWDSLITVEADLETQSNLELARDFLFTETETEERRINLDEGIAELKEQKSKEDMVYAIFVLTAIKVGKVAEALGLSFIDKNVKSKETYIYRVRLEAKSSVYDIEDGEVTINASLNPNRYKNEVLVYPGDKQLSFAWASQKELSGYFVERATEEETEFNPLNSTPFYAAKGSEFDGPINGSFMDDSLTNYKWYRYRFYGITAFGEKVMFAEVKGMPKDLTPPDAPLIKQPQHIKPKEVFVEWNISGDLSDLRGFIVGRSDKDSGDFKILHSELLSNETRNYIDSTFLTGGINYYIVHAVDTSGNISSSYPAYVALIDSIPPIKPIITSAIIDSLGVVTITLELGIENDLMGYKLFKANSPDHEFSVIEEAYKNGKADLNMVKVEFTDTVTLHSLTPEIFYRVKALDFNYNQSEFSEIIAVTRPDTIPPVSPVFSNVVVGEKHVKLNFVPSSSEDVKEHSIYRKTDELKDWEIIKTFDDSLNSFIDTNVTKGITYYYSIRAMDGSGLFSDYASAVYGKPYDTGVRLPIENLSAKVEEKIIILEWDYPVVKTEHTFVIYKRDSNGQIVQYDTTKEKSYTDKRINKENYYAVKVVTNDGGQSILSAIVSKEIEK